MTTFAIIMFMLLLAGALFVAGLVALNKWLSKDRNSGVHRAVNCQHCGSSQMRSEIQCPRCLAPLVTSKGELRRSDLVATARELKRMLRGDVISSEQHDDLVLRMRKEYIRLTSCPEHALPAAMALIGTAPAEQERARPATETAERPAEAASPQVAIDTAPPAEVPLEAEIVEAEVIELQLVVPSALRTQFAAPPVASANKPAAAGAHPLDRPDEPLAPRRPSPARQSVAAMFSGFMEEKNIRWGELLSGLLIVGSTIGLIVSLRSTLAEFPYASALMAMLVTVAIYLAGIYTFKHWKIETTSRGILLIALLLVPLDFLAALVEPNVRTMIDPVYWLAVAIGVGVFGWMMYHSSRILTGSHWQWLVAGLAAPILSMMLIDRLPATWFTPWVTSLVMLPMVAALATSSFRALTDSGEEQPSEERPAALAALERLYLVGGLSLFAVACCLGFYVHVHHGHGGSFSLITLALAVPLSLLSSTLLALGMVVQSRTGGSKLAAIVLPGPVLAILGMAGIVGSLAIAAADPLLLLAAAVLQTILLGVLARRESSVGLGYAAIGSLTLAYLTIVGLVLGLAPLPADGTRLWLLELFRSGPMAVALACWAAALVGVSVLARGKHAPLAAQACLRSGITVVVISLLAAGAVSLLNRDDAPWTTYLLAGYALATLAAGSWTRQREVSAAGAVFAAAALGNALVFGDWMPAWEHAAVHRLALAAGGYATLMLAWWAGETLAGRRERDERHPLAIAAMLGSAVALPIACYLGTLAILPAFGYLIWIAAVWLVLAALLEATHHFFVFRAVLTLAGAYLAVAATQYFYPDVESVPNLRHLLGQVIAVGALSLAWMLLEAAAAGLPRLDKLLGRSGHAEREISHWLALVGIVAIAVALASHGVGTELALIGSQVAAAVPPTSYAGGFWLAWGLVTAALAGRAGLALRTDAPASNALVASPLEQALLLFIGASAMLPIAIALHAEPQLATATALRWCYAVYAIAAAGAVVVMASRATPDGQNLANRLSDPLLALGAVPVCGLTLLAFSCILSGTSPAGPLPESWLARLDPFASYVVPLAMVVGAMVTHGVVLRRPRNLAIGSVTLQAAISLACCLATYLARKPYDTEFAVQLLQANAVALPLYGFVWLALHKWRWADGAEPLLDAQLTFAIAASSAIALWITLNLFLVPTGTPAIEMLSSWPSWLAIAATAALAIVSSRPRNVGRESLLYWSAVAAVALVAGVSVKHFADYGTPWIGAHGMQIGLLAMAFASIALSLRSTAGDRRPQAWFATAMVVAALAFAFRGVAHDPLAPWWQVGMIVSAIAALAWLGIAGRSQLYAYGTTLLAAAIPVAVYMHAPAGGSAFVQTWCLALAAGGLAALAWALLDIWYQHTRNESLDEKFPIAVHRLYAWVLLAGSGFALFITQTALVNGIYSDNLALAAAICLTLLALLGIASLWDRKAAFPLQLLHLAGGWWLGWGLAMTEVYGENLVLAAAVSVTAYHTLIAWFSRRPLAAIGRALTLPHEAERRQGFRSWLLVVAFAANCMVLLFAFFGVLGYDERWQAVLCGMLPALMALQVLLMIDSAARTWLRGVVLLLAVFAAVLLSWADLHGRPLEAEAWLLRMIRTVIVTAALAFLFGVAGARRLAAENPWRGVLARGAIASMLTAIVLLLPILATEVSLFDSSQGLPIDSLHGSAVAVSLLGIMVTLFVFALSKQLDPLQLGDDRKQGYVYAAEAIMVLIGGQVYLMVPELFGGAFRQYWPLVVMAIAFVGVGVSEATRRQGIRVLAEPFYHTSLLLPLLPALGFWIVSAEVSYSLVMFSAGVLYTMLALARRSPLSTVAAIVSGNVAFWALLHDTSFEFVMHPQFWLIPPAASVLLAAQYQREKLGEAQLATIRYLSMMVIYLSSLGEVFIHGIGESLWPSMLLATLAVAGAFAGMALRIRAFLFTGASFLAFAMFSMIWHFVWNIHQAVQHAAVWWAFGITMGLAILLLFALFEKNRAALQSWVLRMQEWEK